MTHYRRTRAAEPTKTETIKGIGIGTSVLLLALIGVGLFVAVGWALFHGYDMRLGPQG